MKNFIMNQDLARLFHGHDFKVYLNELLICPD